MKCAHPSSSTGGSSQNRAQKDPEDEVPLQEASQSGLSPTESKEEEEVAPLLIWSRRGRGPTVLEGIEVAEEPQSKLHQRP